MNTETTILSSSMAQTKQVFIIYFFFVGGFSQKELLSIYAE